MTAFSCQPWKGCFSALSLGTQSWKHSPPHLHPLQNLLRTEATPRPLWLGNAVQRQGLDHWSHRSTHLSSRSLSRCSSGALRRAGEGGATSSGSTTLRDRPKLAALALRSPEVLPSLPLRSRYRRGYRAAPEASPCLPPVANMAVDSAMELLFLDTFKHPSAEVRLHFLIPTLLLDFRTLTRNP